MKEGQKGQPGPNKTLKKGEYFTPDGRLVRDAHFMLEEISEREIDDEAAYMSGSFDVKEVMHGDVARRDTGKHTRGLGQWQVQDNRLQGTDGAGTPGPAKIIPHTRRPKQLKSPPIV